MVSARYEGLSYPTHFLNCRGSVIRKTFLEYRTKHVNIFAQRFFYTLFATTKSKYILKKHILCFCSDTIYSKSIKKNREKFHF